MKDEVSVIIKTFERPIALERLLKSILSSPVADCRILIADDSLHPSACDLLNLENIQYFKLPFDAGVTHGRNYLVDRVLTPYSVLLDDDFFFTRETNLGILLDVVKHQGFDLAAGAVEGGFHGKPGYGNIEVLDGNVTVTLGAPPRKIINTLPQYDLVNNFFLARTETLQDIRWDERFKLYGEQLDFYMRYSAKYKVAFVDNVGIGHCEGGYNFRGGIRKHWPGRIYQASKMFCEKHCVTHFDGREMRGIRGMLNIYIPTIKLLARHGVIFLANKVRGDL